MRFKTAAGALAAAAMMAACGTAADAAEPDSAQVGEARAVVKELGQSLKSRLMEAIKDRGPIAAIGVCKMIAPALAEKTGAAHGLKVGRTALRVRNPANAPDAWERGVLEDFAAQVKAGKDPSKLEYAETVVDAGGGATFRYMKAIPMAAEPCLMCHGAPEPLLKAEIMRLYPQDQATGFRPGDLRGAFTVSAPAAAPLTPPAPAPAVSPAQ
jgi:Protein of unknown function (DUF3365)